MIVEDLLQHLSGRAEGRTVSDVRIGLGYTAVRLDDGACGLAYTFRGEAGHGCSVLREAGGLAGRPALEVAQWATALDALTAAVGVAALNACVKPPSEVVEADVVSSLGLRDQDIVGMVGYFGPLVEPIRQRTQTLHIFERQVEGREGVMPDWAATVLLPRCDVVVLSATSIINRTLDGLLTYCGRAREVVVLGPTTPMTPEIFAPRGVTLLSGVRVVDADRLLRVVSEGGGTRRFGSAVRKLVLRTVEAGRLG